MGRPAKILPGRRCGWPDGTCKLPDGAHADHSGSRLQWGFHEIQCPRPNPRPGPHLDGYPECGLVAGHAGDHDYRRHAAEAAQAHADPERELEAGA